MEKSNKASDKSIFFFVAFHAKPYECYIHVAASHLQRYFLFGRHTQFLFGGENGVMIVFFVNEAKIKSKITWQITSNAVLH